MSSLGPRADVTEACGGVTTVEVVAASFAGSGTRPHRSHCETQGVQDEQTEYEAPNVHEWGRKGVATVRLECIRQRSDDRPLVFAHGSRGMVAGRAGAVCNRGNSHCIGTGLMRKLSRRFVVAPTPEVCTFK
jgi:hypothetical protein